MYNKYLLSTGFETTSRYLDQINQLCCLVATKYRQTCQLLLPETG